MLAWLGDVLRSFAEAENKTGWIRRKIVNRLARRHFRRASQEYAVRGRNLYRPVWESGFHNALAA